LANSLPVVDLESIPVPLDFAALFGPVRNIEVDVGCGKGRFLLARAAAHPDTGFIGIERQRRRVDKLAAHTTRDGLSNLRILHTEIHQAISLLLPNESIRTFYIFFPDPWPKRRHHPRRLISAGFLALLYRKLHPGGCLHFATDDDAYAAAAAEAFQSAKLFIPCPPFMPIPEERTDFELIFAAAGKTPHRHSLQKPDNGPLPHHEPRAGSAASPPRP
jgi:tRNA (guanine-N7-)-methyltransferase